MEKIYKISIVSYKDVLVQADDEEAAYECVEDLFDYGDFDGIDEMECKEEVKSEDLKEKIRHCGKPLKYS